MGSDALRPFQCQPPIVPRPEGGGQPLQLPPNCRDVTAEKIGTVIGIVGATAAKATKPG